MSIRIYTLNIEENTYRKDEKVETELEDVLHFSVNLYSHAQVSKKLKLPISS